MQAKPLLKEALQAHVGLPIDRNIPVIGFIGRLEEQKGSDILAQAIPQFIGEDVQLIVLVRMEKIEMNGFRVLLPLLQFQNLVALRTACLLINNLNY